MGKHYLIWNRFPECGDIWTRPPKDGEPLGEMNLSEALDMLKFYKEQYPNVQMAIVYIGEQSYSGSYIRT